MVANETKDQMTKKLTGIGHRTAFNNKQNSCLYLYNCFFSGFKATATYEECLRDNNITMSTSDGNGTVTKCDFKTIISEVS